MVCTKILNRKSKGVDKALLNAFSTAFGSLQKQILTLQHKSPSHRSNSIQTETLLRQGKASKKEKKIFQGAKKLVPKPPSTAGKSTGYNLQEAMGLSKKARQYNCYLKSVRALCEVVLEPRKTWRQQPMALHVQVVGLVCSGETSVSSKVCHGWPVGDMMKQYLVNAKCYVKQLGDEWDAEPQAEEEVEADENKDKDENGEDEDEDEDSEDKNEDKDGEGEGEAIEDEAEASEDEDEAGEDVAIEDKDVNVEDEDEDMEIEDKDVNVEDKDEAMKVSTDTKHRHKGLVPKGKKKSTMSNPRKALVLLKKSDPPARCSTEKEANRTCTSNENADKHQHPKWKWKMASTSNKNQVNAEMCLDVPTPGPPQKGKGAIKKASNKKVDAEMCLDAPPPSLPQKGKTKHLIAGNALIMTCPQENCTDVVPDEPCQRLKKLIHYHRELIAQADGTGKIELAQVDSVICEELSNELRMLHVAKTNNYPTVIDFAMLPKHINTMLDKIQSLTQAARSSNLKYLEENFIFHRMVYDLVEVKIGTAQQDALVNFSNLPYPAIPDRIREKSRPGYYGPIGYKVIFYSILHQVQATSPDSFYPLSAERCLQFVLIPTIACQFVTEDMEINLQHAHENMLHSADVGEALQQLKHDHKGIMDLNVKITAAEGEGGPSQFQGCLDDDVPEDQRRQPKTWAKTWKPDLPRHKAIKHEVVNHVVSLNPAFEAFGGVTPARFFCSTVPIFAALYTTSIRVLFTNHAYLITGNFKCEFALTYQLKVNGENRQNSREENMYLTGYSGYNQWKIWLK
ncbi:hypothetical protein OG21DRAFT_1521018 [Imleria badia]|nr:hypothetical protein OG21DRAFT_1521018 [Imleria badia]